LEQQQISRNADEIRDWLVQQVAVELSVDPATIDVHIPLTRLGLDSLTAVILSGGLEEWLGVSLPPELIEEFGTIDSLACYLASNGAAGGRERANEERAQPLARACRTSGLKRAVRRLVALLARLLTRMEIEGRERIPPAGPLLLAMNHLHIIDTPLVAQFLPADTAFFVSQHVRQFPLLDWFLRQLGEPVYVSRGESDREAVAGCLAVLRAGRLLGMAPEGRISKTGGLLPGQTGLAYLATESATGILPAVMYGQEKAWDYWRRLRRVPVRFCVGHVVHLPAGKASVQQLKEYTEKLMHTMARMLPPEYRGVYRAALEDVPAGSPVSGTDYS